MTAASNTSRPSPPWQAPAFIWLDLTSRCPLECVHCYAEASPRGGHGQMSTAAWLAVIGQAAVLGVGQVIVIGGEPLYHPGCGDIVRHALAQGMQVEIFSSLYRVTPAQWELAALDGVSLACSYYSDDPAQHEAISGRRGSHARTRANIAEAARRGIPVRVGIIGLTKEQRTRQAMTELSALGIPRKAIGLDRLRAFGRGAAGLPDEADTCGGCGHGNAAILPDGTVTPCVFTRTAAAGSVLAETLGDVLAGGAFAAQVARLDSLRPAARPCVPDMCDPQCGPSCSPACGPAGNCRPSGACAPDYR
ncbi:MAG: radical SAM protein [Streptosporangiaceae bacterium]